MKFSLSLHDRQRFARNKRDRYWRDSDYRLRRINESRAAKGLPPAKSLDEIRLRGANA